MAKFNRLKFGQPRLKQLKLSVLVSQFSRLRFIAHMFQLVKSFCIALQLRLAAGLATARKQLFCATSHLQVQVFMSSPQERRSRTISVLQFHSLSSILFAFPPIDRRLPVAVSIYSRNLQKNLHLHLAGQPTASLAKLADYKLRLLT